MHLTALTLATFGNPNIPGTPACPCVTGPATDAFLAPVSRILVPTAHIDDAIEELSQLPRKNSGRQLQRNTRFSFRPLACGRMITRSLWLLRLRLLASATLWISGRELKRIKRGASAARGGEPEPTGSSRMYRRTDISVIRTCINIVRVTICL